MTGSIAHDTTLNNTRLAQCVRWLCLALVFLQPIPHVGALRQLATYGLLAVVVPRIFLQLRKQAWGRLTAGFARWFWLLAVWAVITSVAGPYPGESLNAMRQGWLPQGLLVAAMLLEFNERRWHLPLLRALVYGFVITTLLGASETLITQGQLINGGVINHDAFLRGYALQAVVSIPIVLLLIFLPATGRFERAFLVTVTLAGIVLVALYNSRTALVALTLGSGGMLLLIGGWRRGVALLAVAALSAAITLNLNVVNIDKYRSLLTEDTYVTDSGLSLRLSVWGGALDIVKERALTGYGYGWKKLSNVIEDRHFIDRWNAARPGAAAFYRREGKVLGYGGANPHNLILQILFEVGAVGFFIYLLLWISWFDTTLRPVLGAMRAGRSGPGRLLLVSSLGVVVAFFLMNITNGYWEGSIANTVFCWLCLTHLMSRELQGTARAVLVPLSPDFNGKILVIRRDNIGDLVCTTPLLHQLRMRFPRAWIAALVNRYNEDVLAGNPDLNAVFSYRKSKHRESGESAFAVFWTRFRQLMALRRMKIDIVLLPASGGQASARQMARLIGAHRIIEQAVDRGGVMHEVERAARVLTPLGVADKLRSLRICADAQGVAAVRAKVAESLPGDGPLVGLHISARKPDPRWPAENFAKLMVQLHARHGACFMLFWSPGDEANPLHPGDDRKAAAIVAVTGTPVLPWPTHKLRDLIDGLAVCDSVICSDGGAMHIAAGLGKPIVCFFGSSDPAIWHPWDVPHQVLRSASRKVADIAVDEAVAAWQGLSR